MTTRLPFARWALLALVGLLPTMLVPAAAGAASDPTAELRVLTPDRVLDPGTHYVLGPQKVKTDPKADCNFGGTGGTGAVFDFPKPTGLSLLAAGADARGSLRPLSVSDEFGFGLAVCAIGGVDDRPGTFWYFKRNHKELTVGADQERIKRGDEFLVYLAPDTFPEPNVKELELIAPARAQTGSQFEVRVVEHGCVTDQNTFETTCGSAPAAGVTITGAPGGATTDASGKAKVRAAKSGKLKLGATRAPDIAAKTLQVCVAEELDACPAKHGRRIFGNAGANKIKGTAGADEIRGGAGRDRIDLRKGGPDKVDCGPGRDTVLVKRKDRDDKIARNCERVRRR